MLCDFYEDDENVSSNCRLKYLKANFYKAIMPDDCISHSFFDINWPYIYTLNIDDVIENSSQYKRVILPNKEVNDDIYSLEKCVIKLHGDITDIIAYTHSDKIFTSKEYAISVNKNASLLNKLHNDYRTQNILFIGCSLDDEMDLKTITKWPFDYTEKDNLSRTIIFVKGAPTKLDISKFKTYGITDIVCFDEFDDMYYFLKKAWEESQKIQQDELDKYNSVNFEQIKKEDVESNQEYFLWNKLLYDLKKNKLRIPFYFITRNILLEIIENIKKNKVHLVSGMRVSGKSYLLVDLCRQIRDREVYYFDGRSRISNKALEKLIQKKKIVALFDNGVLEREQFEYVLQNSTKINENENNLIININNNDSDTFGIVKLKLKQNRINATNIIKYELTNKFDYKNEIKEINKLLPIVNIPPYQKNQSILDQHVAAEEVIQKKGKYSSKNIKIKTSKQLALLILLAIKGRLYSLDIIRYNLDCEIVDALKNYEPFIERAETIRYEKDAGDLSRIKYILNAPYWLKRELGEYARKSENHVLIGDAYRYIISMALVYSGTDKYKRRKVCRDLILFDTMNDIFLNQYHGNLKLIVHVYNELHALLAEDFHFLHQEAKCYLNYAYFLKNESETIDYMNKALELVFISEKMIENEYNDKQNERLQITLAHVRYTKATILCEMCKQKKYCVEDIEKAINACGVAVYSPYNGEEYQKDSLKNKENGVRRFIDYCSVNYGKLNISKESYDELDNLINMGYKRLH